MNNRVQQKFDRSTREAAKASGQAEANDRAVKARWAAMDWANKLPDKASKAVPSDELDALIARLVEQDNLPVE